MFRQKRGAFVLRLNHGMKLIWRESEVLTLRSCRFAKVAHVRENVGFLVSLLRGRFHRRVPQMPSKRGLDRIVTFMVNSCMKELQQRAIQHRSQVINPQFVALPLRKFKSVGRIPSKNSGYKMCISNRLVNRQEETIKFGFKWFGFSGNRDSNRS